MPKEGGGAGDWVLRKKGVGNKAGGCERLQPRNGEARAGAE